MTLRVRRKIDSDTLHIPELASMIGHEVEIIVVDEQAPSDAEPPARSSVDDVDPQAFWRGKSVEELANEQGVGPYRVDDPDRYVFTAEDFEGFDEWLEQERKGR